ncbi:MAG: hypothetical protein JSU79_03520 [Dehalococcoidales bacterium]|nr:MAG: hypothetical protein JSU79_03520 [Dehalococcoidales bacterium]
MSGTIGQLPVEAIDGIGSTFGSEFRGVGINNVSQLTSVSLDDLSVKMSAYPFMRLVEHRYRANLAMSVDTAAVDVTQKITCDNCNGRGVILKEGTCNKCAGSGRIRLIDEDPCPECGGDGMESGYELSTCNPCKGTGSISVTTQKLCVTCGGSGRQIVWSEQEKWLRCAKCGGTGEIWWAMTWQFWVWVFIIPFYFLTAIYKLDCDRCRGEGGWWQGGYVSRNCTICGGKGHVSQTLKKSCLRCQRLGQVIIRYTRECSNCNHTGKIVETHETDCYVCGGSGVFKAKTEAKCPECNSSGSTFGLIQAFKGMAFAEFVRTPTTDLMTSSGLSEESIQYTKQAIGTLYFVLDNKYVDEMAF